MATVWHGSRSLFSDGLIRPLTVLAIDSPGGRAARCGVAWRCGRRGSPCVFHGGRRRQCVADNHAITASLSLQPTSLQLQLLLQLSLSDQTVALHCHV